MYYSKYTKTTVTTFLFLMAISFSLFAQTSKREMRAAWLHTVNFGAWPSVTVPAFNGSNEAARETARTNQKNGLIAYLNQFQAANLNAVFFQVRPTCDAFYKSKYEPWSQFLSSVRGADPGWDPLEFIIEECHKRGMELHAWINPYRISYSATQGAASLTPADYIHTHPEWVLVYSDMIRTLNPGIPEVRERIADVVEDIISNYDVDGIIMDDYFYADSNVGIPTSDAMDQEQYDKYNPENLSRADWRRDNSNKMVKTVYNRILSVKPHVLFGISPAGVASGGASKAGVNPPPVGSDWQYSGVFADPLAWLVEGSLDYISPQLYSAIGSATDYDALSEWWSQIANRFNRFFYPSQNAGLSLSEFENQINLNWEYDLNGSPGTVVWDVINFINLGHIPYLSANRFIHKALPPAIPWKQAATQGMVESIAQTAQTLTWDYSDPNVRYAIYAVPNANRNNPDAFSSSKYLQGISYTKHYSLPAGVNAGTHCIAVSVVDRYGNEFAPRVLGESLTTPTASKLTSPDDNASVGMSATFTWEPVEEAAAYVWQLAHDADFNAVISSRETGEPQFTSGLPTSLKDKTRYYWRVKTLNTNGGDSWSETRSFTCKILARIVKTEMKYDGSGKVIPLYPVYITFSHKPDKSSVEAATGITPAANLAFSWPNDYLLKIDISQLAFETTYKLTINGAVAKDSEMNNFIDGAGNGTEGSDYVLNFTTCDADTAPPVLVSYDPQNKQEESARPIVRIEFDELLNESSIRPDHISVTDKYGIPIAGVQSYYATSNFKSVMHYIFYEDLIPQETYTVKLVSGIEDMYGNAMPNDFTFDFTARPREKTLVTVLDDLNNPYFNNTNGWFQPSTSGTTSGINTVATVVSRDTKILPAVESTGSARLDYLWMETSLTPNVRWHNTLTEPKFSKTDNHIQYYLFGDGSCSKITVALRNGSTGNFWAHTDVELNWVGWKQISWDLTNDPYYCPILSTENMPGGAVLNLSCFLVFPAPIEERYYEVSSIYFSQLRVVKLGDYVTGTGIKEISDENEIHVYTANDYIQMAAPKVIKAVRVYSISGALVQSVQPEQVSYQIPTNDWAPGVYIVKVTTDTSQKHVKAVVRQQ